MNKLNVYMNSGLIGSIIKISDTQTEFTYTDAYIQNHLKSNSCIPLSAMIPICDSVYSGKEIELYLSNMLPEELIRQQLASILKISPNNTFELLYAIGRDCSGAVSFWPENIKPPYQDLNPQGEHIMLKDTDWTDWLNEDTPYPLLNNPDEDIRVSLAGAQVKTVLYFDENDVPYQTKNGAVSTHIIKPPHRWITSNLVRNELVCLHLAKAMKIDTADADIWRKCLRVTRYDRIKYEIENKPDILGRLHQEDFCQILQRAPENKDESTINREDLHKASFQAIDDLGKQGYIRYPAIVKLKLLDLIIFNILIWNTDAHLKNYSLLYDDRGKATLSPAYDLLSTYKLYQKDNHGKSYNLGTNLAISIGGQKKISKINRNNWLQFCKECSISSSIFDKRMNWFASRIYDRALWTLGNIQALYGSDDFHKHFLSNLTQQTQRAKSWTQD